MPFTRAERIAIIGGGCTGVTCFWALQGSEHDVHLFEASSSLNGRIKVLPYEHGENRVDVDTESPSFNAMTSPNLVSLLCCLGITVSAVPFSFSVSDGTNTFEWCGGFLKSILLRPLLLGSLETYRLLLDLVLLKYLNSDSLTFKYWTGGTCKCHKTSSIYEGLSRKGYSNIFRDNYLAPLLSALWRTNAGRFLPSFPFDALVRCLNDHQMLCRTPEWRRIDMGVNNFIEAMTRNFPLERVHLNTNIREIQLSGKGQYSLITSDGQQLYFDHIVFAVDGQEILRLWHPKLLSVEEKEIIEHLKTTKNIAVLHSDVLLTTRISRSAYIYNVATSSHQHRHGDSTALKSCLTYNVNTLQGIPSSLFGPIFITLNPFIPPHPRFVQGIWEFTDPELRSETLHAQARLPSIQNKRGLSYGFRWTGRGFLEDSITAGLEIAVEHLGAKLPFEIDRQYPLDSSEPVSLNSGLKDHLVRVTLTLIRIYVQLLQLGLVLLGAIGTFFPGIRALFMRLNKIRVFKPV